MKKITTRCQKIKSKKGTYVKHTKGVETSAQEINYYLIKIDIEKPLGIPQCTHRQN